MTSPAFQQQQYDPSRSSEQIASRASLLSGLRTGGPRSSSPFEQDYAHGYGGTNAAGQLKATAQAFTPGSGGNSRQSPPAGHQGHFDYHGMHLASGNGSSLTGLEDQLVAMRLQALASQNQVNMNALYGASQGQPQYGQENNFMMLQQQQQQQHRQQLLQQQYLQQQAAARQQLELLRLQTIQQQQAQQQQVAAQQRYLLAQIHAEYDRQAQVASLNAHEKTNAHHQQQQQQQHFNNGINGQASSAQEQRQAAQASIQASLRQRQAQQLYQQLMMEQEQQALNHNRQDSIDEQTLVQAQQQAQQQAQYQALQQQQKQALLHQQQQQQQQQAQQAHARKQSAPPEQRNWRSSSAAVRTTSPPLSGNVRCGSPQSQGQNQQKRERVPSHVVEGASSWRARTVTPSIVIDDSASEDSAANSSTSESGGDQTPETSEENVNVKTLAARKQPNNVNGQGQGNAAKYGSVGKGIPSPAITSTASSASSTPITPYSSNDAKSGGAGGQATVKVPRAISLAAAPRHRAFTEKSNGSSASLSDSNSSLGLPCQPRRQPKGQPTEFKELNFQARINTRTRRDAMSKLCASPRAASFASSMGGFGGFGNPSGGNRMVSAPMS